MIEPGATIIPLIERLRSEYAELPSLRLTRAQIQRLCGVDDTLLCEAVLGALVEVGFLAYSGDGMYIRGPSERTVGPMSPSISSVR
jgi:hypothetical protein